MFNDKFHIPKNCVPSCEFMLKSINWFNSMHPNNCHISWIPKVKMINREEESDRAREYMWKRERDRESKK